MRVLLRCDATTSGGVGHLVRCVAVAEAARGRGLQVTLAGNFEVPLAHRLIGVAGLTVVPEDGASVAALARAHRVDVVHVDHYGVPDVRAAVHSAGALLSSMEDGEYGRRPADFVIDPTLGAESTDRPADGSAQLLRGIGYAPLRASVLRARHLAQHRVHHSGDPQALLLVMGGTDAAAALPAVVALCTGLPLRSLVVVAPRDKWELVRSTAQAGSLPLELVEPQGDLPGLAARHDAAISASGTTVWELACIGVPMALVAVTENQQVGYRQAVAAGVAVGLGDLGAVRAGDSGSRAQLSALLTDSTLRNGLAARGRALVDGGGADRIVRSWEQAPAVGLLARPATPADASLLLAWRNDPTTRASSRSTHKVSGAEHEAWLQRALTEPDRLLFVVHDGGRAVGTVRFDRRTAQLWEVSVTVAPQERGRGLGGSVLAAGEAAWRKTTADGAALLAHVRPQNAASLRLFLAAGYRPAPAHDEDDVVALVKD